jgi:hypothetical protein
MRDRDSWAVISTLAAKEYVVASELARLSLHPYLAQRKARWTPRGASKPMTRCVPLFPKYIFIPVCEARLPQLHFVPGLPGHKFLLTSAEGSIWTTSADCIFEVARLENMGAFDACDVAPGERVRLNTAGPLSAIDLFVSVAGEKMAELFSPLLGGAKVMARSADLVRAG